MCYKIWLLIGFHWACFQFPFNLSCSVFRLMRWRYMVVAEGVGLVFEVCFMSIFITIHIVALDIVNPLVLFSMACPSWKKIIFLLHSLRFPYFFMKSSTTNSHNINKTHLFSHHKLSSPHRLSFSHTLSHIAIISANRDLGLGVFFFSQKQVPVMMRV